MCSLRCPPALSSSRVRPVHEKKKVITRALCWKVENISSCALEKQHFSCQTCCWAAAATTTTHVFIMKWIRTKFFLVTQSCYLCLDYYQATSSDSKCVCSVMNSQATFSNKNVPPNQNVLTRQAVVSVLARTAKPAHAHAKRQRVFWIIEHIFYTGCSALPSQFSQLSHSFGSWCHAGRFRRGQAGVVCLRRPP